MEPSKETQEKTQEGQQPVQSSEPPRSEEKAQQNPWDIPIDPRTLEALQSMIRPQVAKTQEQRVEVPAGGRLVVVWKDEAGQPVNEMVLTPEDIAQLSMTPDDFAMKLICQLPEPSHIEQIIQLMTERGFGARDFLLAVLNMYGNDGHLSQARIDSYVEESRTNQPPWNQPGQQQVAQCGVCLLPFPPKRYGQLYCCNGCGGKANGQPVLYDHAGDCPTGAGQFNVSPMEQHPAFSRTIVRPMSPQMANQVGAAVQFGAGDRSFVSGGTGRR